MTLPELYEALERHDWFHGQSDDHGVWTAGHSDWTRLSRAALDMGPRADRLLSDYTCYVLSGAAFDKPQLPKPKLEDYV